ncbi:Beta-1,4-xylosyltransferase irx9 [Dionaea muscipula]
MPDEEEERSGTSCGRHLALNHIELHRLSGIVNFAGLHNVYDLCFFNEIRSIE